MLKNDARKGMVINIQHYSLHDGPGIRTVVFLKGCPMRCAWCANPESQQTRAEYFIDHEKCLYEKGCKICKNIAADSITYENGKIDLKADYINADDLAACHKRCPTGAFGVFGSVMMVEEVLAIVERDSSFYNRGSGGMTLSGGEPLLQGDFSIALLREAKRRHINTAIETCGYVPEAVLRQAAALTDNIFFDIKLLDSSLHKQFTKVDNDLVLKNAIMLMREFKYVKKCFRTPLIPDVNDNIAEINAIYSFIRENGGTECSYELLPYHRFGESKYKKLNRQVPDFREKLEEELRQELQALVKK